MRILISAAGFFPQAFGGGQVYVYNLARELLSRGHNVAVATNGSFRSDGKQYSIEYYLYENIPVTSFSLNQEGLSYANLQNQYGTPWFEVITGIIKEFNPDIVHINGLKPAFVSACDDLGIPSVVTAHHTGIVCPAGALLQKDGSICKKRMEAKDCVPCSNFWRRPHWYTGGLLGKLPAWFYRRIGKRLIEKPKLSYIERGLIYPWLIEELIITKKMMLDQVKYMIAPSVFIKELLLRNNCRPGKIIVIPHGVKGFSTQPISEFQDRPIRFGYVGRIDPLKGFHVLLEAANYLSNRSRFEIHIFGNTQYPWHENYKNRALNDYKGKGKIVDHGFLPPDKVEDIYSKIDVAVIPSLLPESFGLVVAEAFSAKRPVVVFPSGGLHEQVRHGVNGLVARNNKGKALAEVMQKFIDKTEMVFEMSGRIKPLKTIEEYVNEIENVYRRVFQE